MISTKIYDSERKMSDSVHPNGMAKSPSPVAADKHGFWSGILSCSMYTACSVGMVLSNKAITTSVPHESRSHLPQMSIIAFQCIIAVILVEGAKYIKVVEYPSFSLSIAKSWLPLNLLFIGMLITGFLSLVYVNVPMVTVFKNLTNLVTVSGDIYLFGERFVSTVGTISSVHLNL
jgi:hypothetical protein